MDVIYYYLFNNYTKYNNIILCKNNKGIVTDNFNVDILSGEIQLMYCYILATALIMMTH